MPFADSGGIKIYYEVEGRENAPPIVLQHGLASSMATWRDSGYVAALASEYRLILIDARGHGKSDKPHEEKAYRPGDFAWDIMVVLQSLGLKKAGYWGYSMGASIGFHGIARFALSWFDFLILGGMSPYMQETEVQETKPRLAAYKMAAEQGMEAYVSALEKKDNLKFHPDYRARLLANDGIALYACISSMTTWPDAGLILPHIDIPCLIYTGEADNFCSGAKKGAVAMPKAQFFSLPGLNHVQASRSSELVLPYVKKFLSGVTR